MKKTSVEIEELEELSNENELKKGNQL